MGPLTVVAVVGVAVVLAWRAVRRQRDRMVQALRQAEAGHRRESPVTLEKDPETGVYRPATKRD